MAGTTRKREHHFDRRSTGWLRLAAGVGPVPHELGGRILGSWDAQLRSPCAPPRRALTFVPDSVVGGIDGDSKTCSMEGLESEDEGCATLFPRSNRYLHSWRLLPESQSGPSNPHFGHVSVVQLL